MKALIGYLAYAAGIVAGLALYVFEIIWFYRWWDLIGVVASVMVPPLAAAFPIIYWVREGFTVSYLALFLIAIGGVGLGAWLTD